MGRTYVRLRAIFLAGTHLGSSYCLVPSTLPAEQARRTGLQWGQQRPVFGFRPDDYPAVG